MISSKNLLLNVPPQTTSNTTSSGSSPDGLLGLMLNTTVDKKDDKAAPSTVDPSSFVLLLSQLFTNPAQPPAAPAAGSASTPVDAQTALINELNAASQPQSQAAALLAQQPAVAPQDPTTSTNTSTQVDPQEVSAHNPALNWLESANFQALKGSKDPLPADNLLTQVATPLVQPGIKVPVNTILNSPQVATNAAPAPASDSATTAATTAVSNLVNNIPVLALNQQTINIDQALAPVKAAELDSKIDVTANVNNALAMPVVSHMQSAVEAKTLDIKLPVTHPQWDSQFTDHIAWLGKNDIKSAVIKITPDELGPIEINIKMVKDGASVNIISHSAQVRDIVDQAIPKLRDMMITQGLNLADVQVTVDQRSGNAFAQNNNNQSHEGEAAGFDEGDDEVQMVSTINKPPKGLIDYFA